MLHFVLRDDKHNHDIPLGTQGEFIAEVVKEMRMAKITSKLFSRTADQAALDKEFGFALDRLIQRIRDEHHG